MSVNIHFKGTRNILVPKTGKEEIQTIYFEEVWQTPTSVTFKIMNAIDPFQAYRDWVLENQEEEQKPIYAPEDIFCEGPIVGYKTVNYAKEHVQVFDAWLNQVTEDGYNVITEAW